MADCRRWCNHLSRCHGVLWSEVFIGGIFVPLLLMTALVLDGKYEYHRNVTCCSGFAKIEGFVLRQSSLAASGVGVGVGIDSASDTENGDDSSVGGVGGVGGVLERDQQAAIASQCCVDLRVKAAIESGIEIWKATSADRVRIRNGGNGVVSANATVTTIGIAHLQQPALLDQLQVSTLSSPCHQHWVNYTFVEPTGTGATDYSEEEEQEQESGGGGTMWDWDWDWDWIWTTTPTPASSGETKANVKGKVDTNDNANVNSNANADATAKGIGNESNDRETETLNLNLNLDECQSATGPLASVVSQAWTEEVRAPTNKYRSCGQN